MLSTSKILLNELLMFFDSKTSKIVHLGTCASLRRRGIGRLSRSRGKHRPWEDASRSGPQGASKDQGTPLRVPKHVSQRPTASDNDRYNHAETEHAYGRRRGRRSAIIGISPR